MDTQTVPQAEAATTQDSRIRRVSTVGPLTVSRVYQSNFQKENTLTAELKQTIETKSFYPSKSVANDLKDNIFSTSDFGFAEQEFSNTETRVAWIDVPTNSTPESVAKKLADFKAAGLYRILSNRPILSSDQKYAIAAKVTTMDIIGDSQAVRYPENDETIANGTAGKLIMDQNGKPQFKAVYFKVDGVQDQDRRTSDLSDFYATPAMLSEMNPGSTHAESDQNVIK